MHPVASYPQASLLPAIVIVGVAILGLLILTGNAEAGRRLGLPFWALVAFLFVLVWLMGGLNALIPGGTVQIVR